MELKEALKKRKEELENEFEGHKKEAQFFLKNKAILEKKIQDTNIKLEQLTAKGALIAAKITGLNDMIKE